MKPQLHWFFVCSIILLNTIQCDGIGFTFGFSAAAAAGAALYAGLNKLGCHFYECCDPRADWIKFNATGKGESDYRGLMKQAMGNLRSCYCLVLKDRN